MQPVLAAEKSGQLAVMSIPPSSFLVKAPNPLVPTANMIEACVLVVFRHNGTVWSAISYLQELDNHSKIGLRSSMVVPSFGSTFAVPAMLNGVTCNVANCSAVLMSTAKLVTQFVAGKYI